MLTVKLAAGILALLAVVHPGHCASDFTLTLAPSGQGSIDLAKLGGEFQQAQNPVFDSGPFRNDTAITFARTRLPPCIVRVMHLHRNTDELVVNDGGKVAVAVAKPDGTIVRDVLQEGQAFVIVKNWVHTVYNPDCKQDATFLAFLNAKEGFTSNIAKAAFEINAGPFKAYTDPKFLDSTNNALGTFAADPQCLARCGLGTINGQLPATAEGSTPSASPTPIPAPPTPPTPSAPGGEGTLKLYDQCGGKAGICGSPGAGPCQNSAWSAYTCPAGSTCVKDTEWYYQCRPNKR